MNDSGLPETSLRWNPVTTLADLDSLDEADLLEGFRDGYADAPEPQPGGNRSRSCWHGWRNGMQDNGRIAHAPADFTLTAAYMARMRATRLDSSR